LIRRHFQKYAKPRSKHLKGGFPFSPPWHKKVGACRIPLISYYDGGRSSSEFMLYLLLVLDYCRIMYPVGYFRQLPYVKNSTWI
jgi:hypothetical protein